MLHHVALEIEPAEAERGAAFWELLGFRRVEPPETLAGAVTWLERGATQIHLLHTSSPQAPPQGHAAVVAPAFEETLRRLRAAGYPVEERRPHWGERRAFATAPGGHRVELMAAPPAPATEPRQASG